MPKAYEIVFIDADETLFDFERAKDEALRECFAGIGLELAPDAIRDYDEINEGMWRLVEQGRMEKARLRSERFRLLFRAARHRRRGPSLQRGLHRCPGPRGPTSCRAPRSSAPTSGRNTGSRSSPTASRKCRSRA